MRQDELKGTTSGKRETYRRGSGAWEGWRETNKNIECLKMS